jgi:hypothetical protein
MQATRRRTQEERDLQPSSIASAAAGSGAVAAVGANPRPPRGARGKEEEEWGEKEGREPGRNGDSVVGWDWSRNLGFIQEQTLFSF